MLGCAVVTGVGAVMNAARVPAGARVAVIGAGGVGLNVVQGAVLAAPIRSSRSIDARRRWRSRARSERPTWSSRHRMSKTRSDR